MKIKYLKELIKYYKHFGLKVDKYHISINNFNGEIEIIKHPDNDITEVDIFNAIKINPIPDSPFSINANMKKREKI